MPDGRPPPEECAHCGVTLPRTAKACPECGADERTGWRGASLYDGLDLPDEAWQDATDDTAANVGRRPAPHVNGIPWYWWLVGVMLLGALLIGGLGVFR